MKKVTTKRLVLTRETLSKLDHGARRAAGGATAVTDCGSQSCPVICTFSNGQDTCVTCAGTCTTNNC
jgi:hypothetical protein